MASTDDTNPNHPPQIGGQAELTALSQRLRARADSIFFRDQPLQQIDLHSAAAVINELIRLRTEIRRLADETRDEELELALRALAAGGA
jgi:hypothetical protein